MPIVLRITYTAEPERRLEGEWIPAFPTSLAQRWAVYRTTWFAKKRHQQRPSPKRRLLATFFGPNAEAAAHNLVAHSHRLGRRPPKRQSAERKILYRSLTTAEWLAAQQEEGE